MVKKLVGLKSETYEHPFDREALNKLKKFFSVSIFSSRCAESRMYLPFSNPNFLCTSLASILARLLCNTYAIGEPVT